MPQNWWGGMAGQQAYQMGMDIFNLAQQQAQMQQEQEMQKQQQQIENFFMRRELDMRRERLDLDKARQDLELKFDERRLKTEYLKAQREQKKWNKITEYSQGLSRMIETLDFSSPEDMKKLYAFQAKYQPYGVKPEYLEPERPAGVSPKDYSNLVFRVWNGLKDYLETEYKKAAKAYEAPGWFARTFKEETAQPPELNLPTMGDVKTIVDQMLNRGETAKTLDVNTLVEAMIQQMRPQTQPQIQQPTQQFVPPQSPYARVGEFLDIFNPSKRAYKNLPTDEKRIVDRYMKDVRLTLPEALEWLNEAKAMKAR